MPDTSPSDAEQHSPSRRRTWIILIGAALIGLALWGWRGRTAGPGTKVEATITLVTSDRDDLACASEHRFDQYRCEFRAPGQRWPDPPTAANLLAPYYTIDRRMFVIPGLFDQPVLAARYAKEAPRHLPRTQRPRFEVRCQLTLVDKIKNFQSRWTLTGNFGPEKEAWVATAANCGIL